MDALLPLYMQPIDGVALVRVGPLGDGGYVVPAEVLGRVDALVSLGLGADWRFEDHFRWLSGASVTAYDHTVTPRFWLRRTAGSALRRLRRTPVADKRRHNPTTGYRRYRAFFSQEGCHHRRLAIGDGTGGSVTLRQALNACPGRSLFVKMDIEGAEWQVLDSLIEAADRLVAVAIEFHDVNDHLEQLGTFLAAMGARGFAVVNTAANNVGGCSPEGIPVLVEVTLARRDAFIVDPGRLQEDLNAPNSSLHPEIAIRFAPLFI